MNDLQVRVTSLGAEKVTERGRLQNVCADLQTCRKEVLILLYYFFVFFF